MKYFHFVTLSIILLLCSCNNNNEGDLETPLKISSELEPQSTQIDWVNMSVEERHRYPQVGFVINSVDDFPNEPNVNMDDLKLLNIDFSNQTLLVQYWLIPGYIKGHRFGWYFSNAEDVYYFRAHFTLIRHEDDESDPFTYYRSAVLVNKIMPDKKVNFTFSY